MKSLDVKRCLTLLSAMCQDIGLACSTSMERDLMTIRSRSEHEGQSFFTITLPTFAKAFELALEKGRIAPDLFAGFKAASKLPFPAFLQGLVGQVFDSKGVIQDAPNPDAVEGVRQLCLAFNKVKLECTPRRLRAAEKQFVATEREVAGFRLERWNSWRTFCATSYYLYSRILDRLSDKLNDLDILPRHGPGSTVDKTYGNAKWSDRRWTERLQKTFPYDLYKLYNYNELEDVESSEAILGNADIIKRHDEPPVRVVFVPKTMKTPRVIAIEPVWTQEVQQGLMRELVELLESDRILKGHINFTDQMINRNLAFNSSKSRAFATIDLSEASDRVHPSLVARLFQSKPPLSRAVFSCRSESAILPSGAKLRLRKFASQGSALCFPVEAMVFYSIVVTALLRHRNLPLTRASVNSVARDAYVYGDDIIVPTQEVQCVIEELEAAGLKVNRKKTFSEGHFRESCGMDAYMGVNVTPVYIRHPFPDTRHEAEEIEGTVSTANQFYRKGYWASAAKLRQYVEAVTGVVPHVPDSSPVLGWHSFQQISSFQRWNPDLQRLEVRGLKPRPRRVGDRLDGYRAMHKWSVTRTGKVPVLDTVKPLEEESFMFRVVRGGTKLNLRWAPAT